MVLNPLTVERTNDVIEDILAHHGVKGMQWGVRKEVHPDIAHIPKGTRKEAKKDAEEFTRAKLYFGQGAGVRRRLINATVETKKKKDKLYGEAFDHFVKQTDLDKRAKQARSERKRKDVAKQVKKAINQIGDATGPYLYNEVAPHSYGDRTRRLGLDHTNIILEHHGVKGMQWGVRKQYGASAPTSSSNIKGLEHFSKSQAASMSNVSKKMNKAYGFKVDEFVPLTDKENKRYLAYVMPRGKGSNVIHVSSHSSYHDALKECQDRGWFIKADSSKLIEANLTHEAAHGMFHAADVSGKSFIGAITTKQPIQPMRISAWKKAEEQARKDGDIVSKRFLPDQPQFQMAEKLSKYAHTSMYIEEHEAETFSAYHWSPNPPKFVDAFMTDIHKSMGKSVQPFSGRKVSYGS